MELFYDVKDRPIYPGDLLRTFHFVGSRNKRYYLYHTVVLEGNELYMVPTCHLEPSHATGGGKANLKYMHPETKSEIIHGYGPSPYLRYDERPRKQA